MKALALMALLLSLTGCVTNVVSVGGGNNFTYSGNSNGERTGSVMEECANAVAEVLAKRPDLKDKGDEAFVNCIKDNGVESI